MSIRYVAAVLDCLPSLGVCETLVLIALADFASDDTRECWPSMKTLARRARCDKRAARRIIRRLEELDLVETARGGNQYGAKTASCYRLRFDHQGNRLETVDPTLSTRGTQGPPRQPFLSTRGTLETPRGTVEPPQGGYVGPPIRNRSVIDPKSVDRRLKPKIVDNSGPDRIEQLEGLRKMRT